MRSFEGLVVSAICICVRIVVVVRIASRYLDILLEQTINVY